MAITIVFETHAWSEDNDRGIATGWLPGRLSARGRALAAELGTRRADDGIDDVFCSDLRRAAETAEVAFPDRVPLLDWRLRECDYGTMNGKPAQEVHRSVRGVDERFPGGESWREAMVRVERFLDDLALRWDGARVLVIGHMSVYWALRHRCEGMPLHDLGRDFTWQEGWEFRLDG